MDLPKSIVKEFAKQAVEKKPTVDKPTQLVGTVQVEDGQTFVYLDGSNGSKTPVSETVAYQSGDRVLVSIQNRKATIIGNYTGPSINQALDNVIVEYALSSNSISFIAWPGEKGEWNTIAPEKEDGSYMWQRTTKISTNPLVNPEISLTCIQGSDGENGYTPYIGSNGNWWINGVDTGYSAEGDDGHSPYVDTTTNTWWEWDANIGNYHDTGIVPQGPGVFKSIVFKRFSSQPSAPTGGSYLSPVPSGWSDGIPSGTEQIWISTRVFTSDGESPQTSEWTTPQMASDTPDIDFEYSWIVTNPGNPTDNPDNWSNAATENSIWMAVRKKSIGTWSSWEINKIKGEDGKTYYTWIKYADSPTSGMSDNPSGKAYIGIAHNKTSATESTTYSDYTWSLIKGETGADGNGITTIKQYYARTTTFSKPSAESITSTTMPELDNTYHYLWMKEVIAFTKSENQTVITLIAARGANGEMSAEQLAQLNQASEDASQAKSDVANLEIGGRNYVVKTDSFSLTLNGITVDYDGDVYHVYGTNTKTNAGYGIGNWVQRANIFEPEVVYTVSTTTPLPRGLYLGTNTRNSSGTQIMAASNSYFHGDGSKTSNTFTCTQDTNGELRGFFGVSASCGTVDVTFKIKLEKGNKATDWTPAPEDVDAGIANAQTSADNAQTGVDSLNNTVFGVQTFEYILDGVTIPAHKREDGTYYYILNDEEVTVAEANLVHDSDGNLVSYQDGGIYESIDNMSENIGAIGTKVNNFDARETAIYNAIQDNSLIARKNARVEGNSLIITNDTATEAIANLLNYLQLNADSIVIYGNGKDIVTIAKTADDSGYMKMNGTSMLQAQESRLSTIRLRSADGTGNLALVAGSDGHMSLREVLD